MWPVVAWRFDVASSEKLAADVSASTEVREM